MTARSCGFNSRPEHHIMQRTLPVTSYKDAPGRFAVNVNHDNWTDPARSRGIPVKVYFPTCSAPCPVILFSHGLGGTRQGGEMWGRHWASHGYVSIHLQHAGSDAEALAKIPDDAPHGPATLITADNLIQRVRDVSFVISRMQDINLKSDSALSGILDTSRIGMSGHSFGSATTQALCGQLVPSAPRASPSVSDPRIIAGLALSPSLARNIDPGTAYASIHRPLLLMTGTRDDSPVGTTRAIDRRIPFDHMPGPGQYLAIFRDGDHMVFTGRQRQDASHPVDGPVHTLIRMPT